jgi:hypothetical protein
MGKMTKGFSQTPLRQSLILVGLGLSAAALAGAAIPRPCVGGHLPVGTFRLLVIPPRKHAEPLPLNSVNRIEEGDRLKYEPVDLPPIIRDKAKIALVLVPAAETTKKNLVVLDAKRARSTAEWSVPMRSSIVGVVFGPHGLDVKKISDLVNRDPELIPELAAYAKQTATVNALISTLSGYEASKPGSEDLNAVLQGFSSRYGVALPHLDANAPGGQQAQALLQALVPTVTSYDPLLSGRGLVMQQSAGLAASLAGLFYGTPVGLAAGGAALFEGLRKMIFPNTDLRAAFVEPGAPKDLELCSHNQAPQGRSRLAYLWMLRVPDVSAPSASLSGEPNIPMNVDSSVKVACATHQELRNLPRARAWRLVSGDHEFDVPVKVALGSDADTVSLDLSRSKLPAGDYHLAALWDWQTFEVKGKLNVVPLGNLGAAALTPVSADRLVAGSGPVKVKLAGADFEFVNRMALETLDNDGATSEAVPFTLPRGPGAGTQLLLEAKINTAHLKPGRYRLLMAQSDGRAASVAVTVHPPYPQIDGLPLRINLGQNRQDLTLHGTGLDRIESLESSDATWKLAPLAADSRIGSERMVTVELMPTAKQGELINGRMRADGLTQPLPVFGLALVTGPRPEISSVDISFAQHSTVELDKGEIPAGAPVSFALHLSHADGQPSLELACANEGLTRQALTLAPGAQSGSAQLDFAGEGVLFLSLDPGKVGQSGCELTATVKVARTGESDPYRLGRLVHLPQIGKFSLSNDKVGKALYAGALSGQNLQVIAKTGWDSTHGYPVQGIPTPVPGNSSEQTLQIELPWPPPSPGAPVFIWLRGEEEGRATTATY